MATKKVLTPKQTNIASFFTAPANKQKRPSSSGGAEKDNKSPPPPKQPREEAVVDKSPKDENVCKKSLKNENIVEDDERPSTSKDTSKDNLKSPSLGLSKSIFGGVAKIDFGGSKIEMGNSWRDALKGEFEKHYFQKLSKFLEEERKNKTIYPPENEVFSWTKLHNIKKTKVVIIGQDPYHGPRQAHGLCFSVCSGVPPPPSLKNIYKELKTDIEGFEEPKHGHLIGWSSQGVLLLNACLTVQASKANSHKDRGWEKFTDATIKWLNTNLEGVVFVLWGLYAQKKGATINKSKHLVLSGKHPSPLSAHQGFFGCKHFSKANAYLKEKGKKEINWTYLPESID